MNSGAAKLRTVRFGPFELNLGARQLRKDGVRLKLQDQPFEVLVALLEKPGELITREELKERLWPADTFVDFDRGLNTAINKIREVLGDSAKRPRFIETVPKRGYRFVASGQVHRQERGAVRKRIGWFTAAVLTVAGLALWLSRPRAEQPQPGANLFPSVPLTSYPGAEIHPSFSPDGTQLTFAWNGENGRQYDIYVKLIGPGKLLRLTQNPGDDVSPVWSPDGRWIAFVRRMRQSSSQLSGDIISPQGRIATVLVVPALGGPERKLGEIRVSGMDAGHYMCWSSDGTALIVTDRPSETEPNGLFVIGLRNGEKRRLTTSPFIDCTPSVSPNGRILAFARWLGVGLSEIHILAISERLQPNGPVERVTFKDQQSLGPSWTVDGLSIVFTSGSMSGSRDLWRVPVARRDRPQPVILQSEDVSGSTLARGNARLAFVEGRLDPNIWRLKLQGLSETNGEPQMLISSTYGEKQPQFSPDGRRIAFGSNRSGTEEIWVCDSDGSNAVPITSFGGPTTGAPRWSPDGRRIAFDSSGEIYLIPSDGGTATRLTNDRHVDVVPSWSHDGGWIYFTSTRSGTMHVWKMPVDVPSPSSVAVQLTKEGNGFGPFESLDGRFVFYVRHSRFPTAVSGGDNMRAELWRVPRDGGEETKIVEGIESGGGYALTSQGIYFLAKTDSASGINLKYMPFVGGEIRTVASFRTRVNHLAVSPDGQTILYLQVDRADADLMLVENFR